MPRGSLSDLNREALMPFAQLVYDYLLSFRPTKLVADLARESGISDQAIWGWLRNGVIPHRQTINVLHEATEIPLESLLRAAGLKDSTETALSDLESSVKKDTRIPDPIRHELIGCINEMRASYLKENEVLPAGKRKVV